MGSNILTENLGSEFGLVVIVMAITWLYFSERKLKMLYKRIKLAKKNLFRNVDALKVSPDNNYMLIHT